MTVEVMARARMPGFELARHVMDELEVPKMFEISTPTTSDAPPTITRVEPPAKPQDPAEVAERIKKAHFTAGADKDMVLELYEKHRHEAFNKMNLGGEFLLNGTQYARSPLPCL